MYCQWQALALEHSSTASCYSGLCVVTWLAVLDSEALITQRAQNARSSGRKARRSR